MCKKCWVLVFVLGLSTTLLVYKFIIAGSVVPSIDNRMAVLLSPGERDLVLSEMRTFMESVQQITQGVASNDMQMVTHAAQKVGMAAQQEVPGSLMGKLPLEFKKLGSSTHSQFSQLALDAEQLGDRDHTLTQLSKLTENCVACHATFKFETDITQ